MRDKTTPKHLLLIIVTLVVVLAGATGLVWSKQLDRDKPKPATTTQQTPQQQSPTSTKIVSYQGVEGKNALGLLQTHATVVTKDSSYGPFVDSVNGVQGGTDGKYWAFYVNGQLAQVGAADYATKAGDKIEWKFE